jgi:hypothetical protein
MSFNNANVTPFRASGIENLFTFHLDMPGKKRNRIHGLRRLGASVSVLNW